MPSGVGTGDKCIANLKANILQPRIGLGQQSDQKPRNKSGQPNLVSNNCAKCHLAGNSQMLCSNRCSTFQNYLAIYHLLNIILVLKENVQTNVNS